MTENNAFRKDVTDEEIELHMQPFFKKYNSHVMTSQSSHESFSETTQNKEAKISENSIESLNEEQLPFLESIDSFPFLSVTARAELLGLSAHMNNEIKKYLLANKFILEFNVNLGVGTRGIVKQVKLTPKGYKALNKIPPKHIETLGASPKHDWWEQVIAYYSEQCGYKAEIEKALPNEKRVDVYLIPEKGGRPVGVEVELTAKNAVVNVVKDLEPDVLGKIMVACANNKVKQAVKDKLERVLNNQQWELVQVMLLSDFHFVKDIINGTKA